MEIFVRHEFETLISKKDHNTRGSEKIGVRGELKKPAMGRLANELCTVPKKRKKQKKGGSLVQAKISFKKRD